MALDDSVFKLAIAKINRAKPKSNIPQVLVFQDPPHLKKSNEAMPSDDINIPLSVKDETILQSSPHPIPSNSDQIPAPTQVAIENTDATNRVHKYGTKKGTEQGTKTIDLVNRVHKDSTKNSTKKGTNKGTEKEYNSIKNNNLDSPIYPSFIYQRPYDALSGIPKKIVDTIFELCRKYGGKETPPIPFAMLVKLCNEKKNSVKVTRQRLLEEGIIATKESSETPARGRSGMLVYRLREDIFEEINDTLSLLIKRHDMSDKKGTEWGTKKGTELSSSSSYINTTTTDIPETWKKIDVSPLASINFGRTEIKNIFRKSAGNISPEIIQDSINQFAFGLTNNPDRYRGMNAPAGLLVKTLSEGTPWKESGYISVEEKLRIEKESKIRELLEKQMKEPKFLEWFNHLTDEEKSNLVPDGLKGSAAYTISKNIIEKEQAKYHFEQSIWPEMIVKLKMDFLQS